MRTDRGGVLLITGGVGGAKLAYGFSKIYQNNLLSYLVNTADDFEYAGLNISPDIDTLLYTLSGKSDKDRGWGIAEDTWNCLGSLGDLGMETWFQLGDKDLATHLYRTQQISLGYSLSSVVSDLASRFSIQSLVMPMTDERVRTVLHTEENDLDFQEYFVRRKCGPVISSISFSGIDLSKPSSALVQYFSESPPSLIIICPSNPFLSIDPILNVPGLTQLISNSGVSVVGVSPIVSGEALKGPTGKILAELNRKVSAFSVAEYYSEKYPGLISCFVIDDADKDLAESIQRLGLSVIITNTIMITDLDKKELALSLLDQLM